MSNVHNLVVQFSDFNMNLAALSFLNQEIGTRYGEKARPVAHTLRAWLEDMAYNQKNKIYYDARLTSEEEQIHTLQEVAYLSNAGKQVLGLEISSVKTAVLARVAETEITGDPGEVLQRIDACVDRVHQLTDRQNLHLMHSLRPILSRNLVLQADRIYATPPDAPFNFTFVITEGDTSTVFDLTFYTDTTQAVSEDITSEEAMKVVTPNASIEVSEEVQNDEAKVGAEEAPQTSGDTEVAAQANPTVELNFAPFGAAVITFNAYGELPAELIDTIVSDVEYSARTVEDAVKATVFNMLYPASSVADVHAGQEAINHVYQRLIEEVTKRCQQKAG